MSRFDFDAFVSYAAVDRQIVVPIAERLRADGVSIWLDQWRLRPGDSIPAKIENALEKSRVLLFFMSRHAFGSNWTALEAGTFRFRDPLNTERRFVPVRLDASPIPGSLGQFLYVDLLQGDQDIEYRKLLEACQPDLVPDLSVQQDANAQAQLDLARHAGYSFSADGGRALTATNSVVRLWDVVTRRTLREFEGHLAPVLVVVWSPDERWALTGSRDTTVRLWDIERGTCKRVFKGHDGPVWAIAVDSSYQRALTASSDRTIKLWHVEDGRCVRTFSGHSGEVRSVAWAPDGRRFVSGGDVGDLRLWNASRTECLRQLSGHEETIRALAWSPDGALILSCSDDNTLRVWEADTGVCKGVLEGHTDTVLTVAWARDSYHALSGSSDLTVRVWNTRTGQCLQVFDARSAPVVTVSPTAQHGVIASGDSNGMARLWTIANWVDVSSEADQVQYLNAKVLFVGDSGAGKTGLARRLATKEWLPSDSTVGAWATQWSMPATDGDSVEREIWLWDFGGQADQRIIHQLYMDDTALAVLVFDGQRDNLFAGLAQWDRDLTRAARRQIGKVLVAGRVDAGGLRVSRAHLDEFALSHGYQRVLETSAKLGLGCTELQEAIIAGIDWHAIPWRSSPRLFKRLKEEIVKLRDESRILMRFNELREALHLRLAEHGIRFDDVSLRAVLGLLVGPGVVWELRFGGLILLRPEVINAYAQAVLRTMQADEGDDGCIGEELVLSGELLYQSSMERVSPEDERFVLLAMHQMLIERHLCMRQTTDDGTLLIFPSQYRRERPELVEHRSVLVHYRFNGTIDEIYATLVVRLNHTKSFAWKKLWRYAADFVTVGGRRLGIRLTKRAEGSGELEVYFDPDAALEDKIVFTMYIQEHLTQKGLDVVRLRRYMCGGCGTSVGNPDVAARRLAAWLARRDGGEDAGASPTIVCSDCEDRVPLWDEFEQHFNSPSVMREVRRLEERAEGVVEATSVERSVIGEILSTVAVAGQRCDELVGSKDGIDLDIEFVDDHGQQTGRHVLVQICSQERYELVRSDEQVTGVIARNAENARVLRKYDVPVMLVFRGPTNELRWSRILSWSVARTKPVGSGPVYEFSHERLDVMSVRRMRQRRLMA